MYDIKKDKDGHFDRHEKMDILTTEQTDRQTNRLTGGEELYAEPVPGVGGLALTGGVLGEVGTGVETGEGGQDVGHGQDDGDHTQQAASHGRRQTDQDLQETERSICGLLGLLID